MTSASQSDGRSGPAAPRFHPPWRDRAGRFSRTKALCLALLCLPAALMLAALLGGRLGAEPVESLINMTGTWGLRIVLVSLVVTPLRRIAGWGWLMPCRRMIGVAAFAYLAAHFALYTVDFSSGPVGLAVEIASRVYLAVGFIALLLFAALAATSFDGAVKRLGGPRWRRLHRLTYLATALGLVHFTLHAKLDVTLPVIFWGLFAWLMAFRALDRDQKTRPRAWVSVALSVAAAVLTGLAEMAWYHVATGVPADRILAANWTLAAGVRPAWWVLSITLAVSALAMIRRPPKRRRERGDRDRQPGPSGTAPAAAAAAERA